MTEHKTVAEFLLPHPEKTGGHLYESHEVPPGDRDPQVPSLTGPPELAYGVRFFDQVVTEIRDPVGGDPVVCRSNRLDPSPGTFFYQGTVYVVSEVISGTTNLPLMAEQYIAQKFDSYAHVIRFLDGTVLPFNKYVDQIL
jgi:hypothetical protein